MATTINATVDATTFTAKPSRTENLLEEIIQLMMLIEKGKTTLVSVRGQLAAVAAAVSVVDADITRAIKFNLILGRESDRVAAAQKTLAFVRERIANPVKVEGFWNTLGSWFGSGMEMLDATCATVSKEMVAFAEKYPGINMLFNTPTVCKAAAVQQYRATSENPIGVVAGDVVTSM